MAELYAANPASALLTYLLINTNIYLCLYMKLWTSLFVVDNLRTIMVYCHM